MLALEAVLPTGEIIHTGSKAVKIVVGYDLTQLLVGSEGTLAIITEIALRLIPKPQAHATLLAEFADISHAVEAVTKLIAVARRDRPPSRLVDADSLGRARGACGATDGLAGCGRRPHRGGGRLGGGGRAELLLVEEACRAAKAIAVRRAASEAEREEIWNLRRELSAAFEEDFDGQAQQ